MQAPFGYAFRVKAPSNNATVVPCKTGISPEGEHQFTLSILLSHVYAGITMVSLPDINWSLKGKHDYHDDPNEGMYRTPGRVVLSAKGKELTLRTPGGQETKFNLTQSVPLVLQLSIHQNVRGGEVRFYNYQMNSMQMKEESQATICLTPPNPFEASPVLRARLLKMLSTPSHPDVILVLSDGSEMSAIREFLTSGSDYFKTMFQTQLKISDDQTQKIKIDAKPSIFKELIKLIYGVYDAVEIPNGEAVEFLHKMDFYQVKCPFPLDTLLSPIMKQLTKENCAEMLEVSFRLQFRSLSHRIIDFIFKDRQEIFKARSLKGISTESALRLMEEMMTRQMLA